WPRVRASPARSLGKVSASEVDAAVIPVSIPLHRPLFRGSFLILPIHVGRRGGGQLAAGRSRKVKIEPPPGRFSTDTLPSCASATRETMASPRPRLSALPRSRRQKRRKI